MGDANRIVSPARSLAQCHSVADLQRLARRRLPAPMYHYLEGGADDEWTLRRNMTAFDDYELWPNYLTDISSIDLSTTLLGRRIALPFFSRPPACHGCSITRRNWPWRAPRRNSARSMPCRRWARRRSRTSPRWVPARGYSRSMSSRTASSRANTCSAASPRATTRSA
jgi:hypothetical protein